MKKTLLIYEGKYGFTEEVIKKMAMILGPAKFCKPDEFKEEYKDFDFIVIGSSVVYEDINKNIYEFISKNKEWLSNKKIALFCTCLKEKGGEEYLNSAVEQLGSSVVWVKAIMGRLIIDSLDEVDYTAMKKFSEFSGLPFADNDKSKIDQIVKGALEIKHIRDHNSTMPEEELKKYIDSFFRNHNTCTLSTTNGVKTRSTPIEYTYKEGFMYFISEGGEKFANILMNDNVSMAIYEEFDGMDKLAGMQLLGRAHIIDINSDEYREFMKVKGISIDKLPVILNLIRVNLMEVEMLWAGFKNIGYDIKQYYKYK